VREQVVECLSLARTAHEPDETSEQARPSLRHRYSTVERSDAEPKPADVVADAVAVIGLTWKRSE
jgi:hypothetical protein